MAVYVIQRDRTKDFSDAEGFGPLHYLLGRSVFPDSVGTDVKTARIMLEDRLKDFYFKEDFVLLNGDPVHAAMVTVVLGKQKIPYIRFLKWDRENRAYYEVEVSLT